MPTAGALEVSEATREDVAAEGFGLEPSFETAWMDASPAPDEPVQRVFGVTSLELG